MSDLLATRRSGRRSPLVLVGTGLFGLLAVLAAVDAVRGAPPEAIQGAISVRDATLYRAGAAAICAVIAVWIFVAGGPRREDRTSLLR